MATQTYQTLYRKYRPGQFGDFVGQGHVVTTLCHAIAGDRVAHAYLFTGPRGTGKTSIAKIFAKALNCESRQDAEPCNHCSNCAHINEGNFLDVVEIDGASNRGIDEIRELREKVKFTPAEGNFKVYIIDEVHMLTAEAFNALLKTLEEPPRFVVFILATTEVHKIPPTILSRCQRFDFKRFTVKEIEGRLAQVVTAEQVKSSEKALELIATYAEGGMRDALGLLEQALAHSQGCLEESNVRAILGLIDQEEIDLILTALKERDTRQALTTLNDLALAGKDLYQFGRSLIAHLREMLLESLASRASKFKFTPGELVHIIETMAIATNEVKKSQQNMLPLELAFIKLTAPSNDTASLEARVAKLEAMLFAKNAAPSGPPSAGQVSQPEPKVSEPVPVRAGETVANSEANFNWDQFIEAVKKKKRTLAALIQEGKPAPITEGQLRVEFPPHLKFHLENLALPANLELLEEILKELTGHTIKIACVPETGAAGTAGDVEPTQTGADLLSKTIAIFGGEAKPIKKEENKQ